MGVEAAVTVTTVDEVRVVRAIGEFDPDSDESLAVTLVPSVDRPTGTILDLAEVTFADSAFLHTLLAAKTEHDRVGVPFVLTRLPPVVERLLTLTDVARAFDLTSDIRAAVELIRSRGDAADR
ncbi:STAS domain-containing protein [Strepomyces sp. STD 3.1]|uniref:STAS domain-containing protein n=1 Tax=Streptomyces sp. NPDC058985 TaxID=3346684 RepID=UPI001F1F261C|nr:STAS domain-containing protein [Streptomyces sp. STD 3.1]